MEDEGRSKRIEYKWKFFAESRAFKEIMEKLEELQCDGNRADEWKEFFEGDIRKRYPWMPENPVGVRAGAENEKRLVWNFEGFLETPSIRVLSLRQDQIPDSLGSLYQETNVEFMKADRAERARADVEPEIFIDAVNRERNSIIIEISLERDKEDIQRDVDLLLDVLEKEAEMFGYDDGRGHRRKPKQSDATYDRYDLLLNVWQAVEREKKTIREVAQEMSPDMFKSDHTAEAADNEEPVSETERESAVQRVEEYYREAEKMINEGGWRDI